MLPRRKVHVVVDDESAHADVEIGVRRLAPICCQLDVEATRSIGLMPLSIRRECYVREKGPARPALAFPWCSTYDPAAAGSLLTASRGGDLIRSQCPWPIPFSDGPARARILGFRRPLAVGAEGNDGRYRRDTNPA